MGFGGVGQLISGDLLDQELIVRQITVEGLDDPVPVGPDESRLVLLETVRVGVPGRIQPVPPPALTVMGRGEQTRHRAIPGIGSFVSEEPIHFGRGRRQPGQVQVETAQQSDAVGLRGWLEPLSFEASQDKPIDGCPRPIRAAHAGRFRPHRGLPSPMIPAHGIRQGRPTGDPADPKCPHQYDAPNQRRESDGGVHNPHTVPRAPKPVQWDLNPQRVAPDTPCTCHSSRV